ncbi:Fc receptor-like protein 5 [Xenopus laevis]|uniref:Fc receptor-like protein 5 n=1 Tax=Xenopus laevis TaxID=8355 RepID=A0A8J1LK02_XENLA|nr:Fc receptor-like protein 5 [Xenopus laevis]
MVMSGVEMERYKLTAATKGDTELISNPEIRVSSDVIIEGSDLAISCHYTPMSPGESSGLQFALYRDGIIFKEFSYSSYWYISRARAEQSGDYTCAVRLSNGQERRSSSVDIKIQELFSQPEIRVNINPITEGDTLSLTCDTQRSQYGNTQLEFYFNKWTIGLLQSRTGQQFKPGQFSLSSEYRVPSVQLQHSGDYSCAAATPDNRVYKRSSPIAIQITELFSKPELRVSSNPITEGTTLTLTCDTTPSTVSTEELQFAFYWDGQEVQGFSSSNQYQVDSVQLKDSGNYNCKVQHPAKSINKTSEVSYIQVVELFSKPELRVSSNPFTEGTTLTLTCDTTPSTVSTEELQFAFYWDGQEVQGFSSSNQYQVDSVQLEDSGNYNCKVQHPAKSIIKTSKFSYIQIVELFSRPVIKVNINPITEGDTLSLTCDTQRSQYRKNTQLKFLFYKKWGNILQLSLSSEYRVPAVQLQHSGDYSCAAATPNNRVYKLSSPITIQITEMFSKPELRVSSNPITEGTTLTLTCDTTPITVSTEELQFAFYWDGQEVQGFSSSNQYQVDSVQMEDSGNYNCKVQHPAKSIYKTSELSYIQVVGGAVRPVVSLSPNWANILTGDQVTLTCDVGSTAGTTPSYSWYKDNEKMNKYIQTNGQIIINYAHETHSGNYQCQTDTSERSESVRLNVTDAPLILQAPPYVYEGDSLSMRCYSKSGSDTVFYKDNNTIKPMNGDHLYIHKVNVTVTGTYRCSKRKFIRPSTYHDLHQTDEEFISVRELFSSPEIKVSPSPLAEDSDMIITCDTALHPSRRSTMLEFAFYKDGNTVRNFSLSKRYRVCSIGPGDLGDYSCAVRTVTGSVLKMSNVTQIQIQGKCGNNGLIVFSAISPFLVIQLNVSKAPVSCFI